MNELCTNRILFKLTYPNEQKKSALNLNLFDLKTNHKRCFQNPEGIFVKKKFSGNFKYFNFMVLFNLPSYNTTISFIIF